MVELGVESLEPNMAPNALCLGCQFITLASSIWIWESCAFATLTIASRGEAGSAASAICGTRKVPVMQASALKSAVPVMSTLPAKSPDAAGTDDSAGREQWPVSVANQFDSTTATLRLAEMTGQVSELKEFISASRQLPKLREASAQAAPAAPAKLHAIHPMGTQQLPHDPFGRRTHVAKISCPVGPVLRHGSTSYLRFAATVWTLMSAP